MKRISKINPQVQKKVIVELKTKLPDGGPFFTLKQIADQNDISLTAVNTIARHAKIWRPRRVHKLHAPPAWVLKILRDFNEPNITLAEVGRRNPRVVMVRGRSKERPRSKQRIKQIIDFWKKRNKALEVFRQGYQPGDIIEWNERQFKVLRYDNTHRGAVEEISDGFTIDPFNWFHQNMRAKLIKTVDGRPLNGQEVGA